MDKIKVSVIIPAYNVEKYICQCMDSVINQSLNDIEIICIDDGSTDSTGIILDQYAEKDNRIKVVHKNNNGQGAARNTGLTLASGEYVYFLDSDDLIQNNALFELYEFATNNCLDICQFDGKSFFENEQLQKNYNDFDEYYVRTIDYSKIQSGPEMYRIQMNDGQYRPNLCLHLYKCSLIKENHLLFREGVIYEDEIFNLLTIIYSKKVAHIGNCYHFRRVRNGSTMTSKASMLHLFSSIYLYIDFLKIINDIRSQSIRDTISLALNSSAKRLYKQYTELKGTYLDNIFSGKYEELSMFERTLISNIGIKFNSLPLFPFDKVPPKSKIIIYGAGNIGKGYYYQLIQSNYCNIVGWFDRQYKKISQDKCLPVKSPDEICKEDYDFIVIAIENKKTILSVEQFLLSIGNKKNQIIIPDMKYLYRL